MGRLKFAVKDFRSDSQPATIDSLAGQKDANSPVKKAPQPKPTSHRSSSQHNLAPKVDDDDSDEIAEEEMVEIECGIANADDQIQCKVCWSDD